MADAKPVSVGPKMPSVTPETAGKKNETLKPEDKRLTPTGPETDGPVISTVGEGAGAVTVYGPAAYKTTRGNGRQDR